MSFDLPQAPASVIWAAIVTVLSRDRSLRDIVRQFRRRASIPFLQLAGRRADLHRREARQRPLELSGPTPVDPSRTDLPEEWRALAFLVEPGASLALAEVRRGESEPPPDALTLARELWLDPDGVAASVRDRFGGTLSATTRLDLLPPGDLGRVAMTDRISS